MLSPLATLSVKLETKSFPATPEVLYIPSHPSKAPSSNNERGRILCGAFCQRIILLICLSLKNISPTTASTATILSSRNLAAR